MLIEDHDYHVMDNTNENVTDNFLHYLKFHRKNELMVNNLTNQTLQTVTNINQGTIPVESFTSPWHIIPNTSDGHNESFLSEFNCSHTNETFCALTDNFGQNQTYSTVSRIILALTAFIICIVALAANLLILVTITFTKRLRTANAAFLINLSTSDLLVGAIVLPMVLTGIISDNTSSMFQQVIISFCLFNFVYSICLSLFDIVLTIDLNTFICMYASNNLII